MTDPAASRDVSNGGARAVWPKASEGKRYDGVQTPPRSESLEQHALEVSEARPVCGRGAQPLAQLAGGTVTPHRRHIDMRIGEVG